MKSKIITSNKSFRPITIEVVFENFQEVVDLEKTLGAEEHSSPLYADLFQILSTPQDYEG